MRALSIEHPRKVLTIIHDKMDHGKTTSSSFASKNKDIDVVTKLPLSVTCMMTHGHRDERYAYFPLLMKLYMDMKNVLVIPHMIKELPDWRAFVSEHISDGKEKPIGHMKAQQFRFCV